MPSRIGRATFFPFLSTSACAGESAQVCGLSIVAASGVGQPFGYFSRLPGSVAGRANEVTASASATIATPMSVAAVSS